MTQHRYKSRAAVAGHPIHPILIHFPVAGLLLVAGSDVMYIVGGDPFWARVSLWLLAVGVLGGLVAAMAGIIDLVSVPAVRRLVTGWCHAIIAVLLLSVASFNWLIRVDDIEANLQPWGIYLSGMGAVLTMLAGYFGGNLVYEHGIAVQKSES